MNELKKFRLSLKLGQDKFAKILNVNHSLISKIENEKVKISKKFAEKVLQSFNYVIKI